MAKYSLLLLVGIAWSGMLPNRYADAGDLMVGCLSRPACGKVCQLVNEKKKLIVFCYGSACQEICIPGLSRPGCKHCATCGDQAACQDQCGADCGLCGDGCQVQQPECKFYWRDWFACGCGTPRTVKVLTKYQAEKEIDWYHWKVVDGVDCGCPTCCGSVDSSIISTNRHDGLAANSVDGRMCVYKPAPLDANLGDAFELNDEERQQLAQMTMRLDAAPQSPVATDAEPAGEPAWQGIARYFRLDE